MLHAAEKGRAVIGNARRPAPVVRDVCGAFGRKGREASVEGVLEACLKGLGTRGRRSS